MRCENGSNRCDFVDGVSLLDRLAGFPRRLKAGVAMMTMTVEAEDAVSSQTAVTIVIAVRNKISIFDVVASDFCSNFFFSPYRGLISWHDE